MIRAILYDPPDGRLADGGAELIDDWERSQSAMIWVVFEDEPPETEQSLLSKRFGIHPWHWPTRSVSVTRPRSRSSKTTPSYS